MIIIKNLEQLRKYKELIKCLYEKYGRIYYHDPKSISAMYKQKNGINFYIIIDEKQKILTAFEKLDDEVWGCCFSGYPILASKRINPNSILKFLNNLKKILEATAFYFPLVYEDDYVFKQIKNNKLLITNKRLPSPIIEQPLDPNIIWRRVVKRYGSRANRQKKKFESMLITKSFSGINILNKIKKVELSSWKRGSRQDMLSRDNQIAYYTDIVKSGIAEATFAFTKEMQPVAFRIDTRVKDKLFILKWSYDEKYKSYSPGFYLLTIDLINKYKNEDVSYIDLYGSPDGLKDLLESNRLKRRDVFFTEKVDYVKPIISERGAFDAKIVNNYRLKQSIKKIYSKKHYD